MQQEILRVGSLHFNPVRLQGPIHRPPDSPKLTLREEHAARNVGLSKRNEQIRDVISGLDTIEASKGVENIPQEAKCVESIPQVQFEKQTTRPVPEGSKGVC